MSSTAYIGYGVVLQDEYGSPSEPPWHVAEVTDVHGKKRRPKYGESEFSSVEEWWLALTGFENTLEIYDEQGNFPGGVRPPEEDITRFHEEERQWLVDHPLPFEIQPAGSDDCKHYVLLVPGTTTSADRFEPAGFEPSKLRVDVMAELEFKEALKKIGISAEPGWQLFCHGR